MGRHGGRVQLEQFDMHLALIIVKMAKGGLSSAAKEETEQGIKKPSVEVLEEKKRRVEIPGNRKVKAAIERHRAIVLESQPDGCLPCQNGTAINPQTLWSSVCTWCRNPSSGQGVDHKNRSVQIHTRPKARPATSWRAKSGPGSVNLRFCLVWLDLLVAIGGFAFRVSLFIVAFRCATLKRKMFSLVCSGQFWMYWPP
jgi:hypothetical protein